MIPGTKRQAAGGLLLLIVDWLAAVIGSTPELHHEQCARLRPLRVKSLPLQMRQSLRHQNPIFPPVSHILEASLMQA